MNEKIKLPPLKTREIVLDIRNDIDIEEFIKALMKAGEAGATKVVAWEDMSEVRITTYRPFSEEEMREKYIKLLQEKIEEIKSGHIDISRQVLKSDTFRKK